MTGLERLMNRLEILYKKRTPRSFRLFRRAQNVMIQGGSHSLRLLAPYPFFVRRASGPEVVDIDGNVYVDYWQGHYANILGHNPVIPDDPPAGEEPDDPSLHTGFEGEDQVKLAEILIRQAGWKGHKVRFTTSGTLAAMYAVMLACGRTGREEVLKIGGGWHGASPLLLKGIAYDRSLGFTKVESAGVPSAFSKKIHTVRYNDSEGLIRFLRRRGEKIACFILEPYLGAGGFIPADREYLQTAREWTSRLGIVLVFDEIISGFRFAPTGVGRLAGVEPDLATFGKAIGGGHAVAAVMGKTDILECLLPRAGRRTAVRFSGGTYSAHPQYMRAGLRMIRHLARHGPEIYPRIAAMGERLRRGIEDAFAAEGIDARCAGRGNDVIPGSSLFMPHFLRVRHEIREAGDVLDPRRADVRMKEEILRLALLTRSVHVVHGGGAVSAAHREADIDRTIEAYRDVARLLNPAVLG
ncbi:MAG: aminotransferase class III-fold pyridoxal phosphate-dependent enzyme [Acidobacteria bacterium]|mgnify:FL=1|nr:aminotransferase class III-fold pyridoxal phosphate-dependent enzyme [Acidobacteriota bacterium]MDD8010884.1 aminotransferase class III-fold pyridoxal phosphate-dependent enzyme [Acidobacteriota bacterium]NMD09748.1 aminotransferase class III-fold pyridoxal phosphate-dependent enzyme [Acidobacteriota bacterium]